MNTKFLESLEQVKRGPIPAWSHNRIKTFERCAYALERQCVQKETYYDNEAEAIVHGNMVHKCYENYVSGKTNQIGYDAPNPLMNPLLETLRLKHAEGLVTLEDKWGFNEQWEDMDYFHKDVWGRVVIDVFEWTTQHKHTATIHDWKSGNASDTAKFKYTDQMNTYAISSFMKFPELQFVETRLQFTDKPMDPLKQQYTRAQGIQLATSLIRRAKAQTYASFFPPNPSKSNCRFCDYAEHETCEYRYEG